MHSKVHISDICWVLSHLPSLCVLVIMVCKCVYLLPRTFGLRVSVMEPALILPRCWVEHKLYTGGYIRGKYQWEMNGERKAFCQCKWLLCCVTGQRNLYGERRSLQRPRTAWVLCSVRFIQGMINLSISYFFIVAVKCCFNHVCDRWPFYMLSVIAPAIMSFSALPLSCKPLPSLFPHALEKACSRPPAPFLMGKRIIITVICGMEAGVENENKSGQQSV